MISPQNQKTQQNSANVRLILYSWYIIIILLCDLMTYIIQHNIYNNNIH